MLFMYASIGLLTLLIIYGMAYLNRTVARLTKDQQILRKEHIQLRAEHIELQKYCYTLETRIKYLERSRQLLAHIVKNANVRTRTGTDPQPKFRLIR